MATEDWSCVFHDKVYPNHDFTYGDRCRRCGAEKLAPAGDRDPRQLAVGALDRLRDNGGIYEITDAERDRIANAVLSAIEPFLAPAVASSGPDLSDWGSPEDASYNAPAGLGASSQPGDKTGPPVGGIAHAILNVLRKEGPKTLTQLEAHPGVHGAHRGIQEALTRSRKKGWVEKERGHWTAVKLAGETPVTGIIRAPWSFEQVETLNRFQRFGGMHPFTCGGEHTPGSPSLVARTYGWRCPDPYGEGCAYTQDWAHAFMADPEVVDSLIRRPFGNTTGRLDA